MNPIVFNKELIDKGEGHLNGIRCIAASQNGRWMATGDLAGTVLVTRDDAELYTLDVRPMNYKANADRFLHTMSFSRNGDLLICCSGVDVVALNSITGTVAWEFHPSRQFGFLRTVPLGLTVTEDDHVVVSCSNGQFVRLDRKGRVEKAVYENDSPQSLVTVARMGLIVGTEGFHFVAWDSETLERRFVLGETGRYFAVSAAGWEPRVAVRVPGSIRVLDMVSRTVLADLACGPGLPVTAMSPEGGYVGYLENGVPTLVEVESGRTRQASKFGCKAVTVSWLYREEQFGFGFVDGSMEAVEF